MSDATQILGVVVIGAGMSGLTAATRLTAHGVTVRVLEARDRVGGRLKLGALAGHHIDLGGMWIGPTQKRLMAAVTARKLRTYATHLTGRNIVRLAGRSASSEGEDVGGVLGLFGGLEYLSLMRRLQAIGASGSLLELQEGAALRGLDGWTMAAWLDRFARSLSARAAITFQVRSLLCVEPEDVSVRFFAFYLASGDGAQTLLSAGPGGAQNFAVEGGLAQLPAMLSDDLGDRVQLNCEVRAITQHADNVRVSFEGGAISARRCIVAVPPTLAAQINWSPDLPHRRDLLTRRMAMGSVIKVWLAYKRPFWRERGLNGFLMSDEAPFGPCFDVSPPDQSHGLIVGFFDAVHARKWTSCGSMARQEEAVRTLAAAFGSEAMLPIAVTEQDWVQTRWSRGCYGGFAPPGLLNECASALREPIGLVHWAGTESSLEWCGYVEGAIAVGERAAEEVNHILDK